MIESATRSMATGTPEATATALPNGHQDDHRAAINAADTALTGPARVAATRAISDP